MSKVVALVLDPGFGEKVGPLAQTMPVWIVSSPINDLAVRTLRSKFKEQDITTLFMRPDEQYSDILSRALYAIDEHHGPVSQLVPYDTVEAYGAKDIPSPELASELGFRSVVLTSHGFRAVK